MISAGTVTVDLQAGKILLALNKPQGIYQLPKGRKNVGEESLLECAVRETLEETGMVVEPLALRVATRCTVDGVESGQDAKGHGSNGHAGEEAEDDGGVETAEAKAKADGQVGRGPDSEPDSAQGPGIEDRLNNESVGLCQYRDATTGAMKLIFYYAATGDSQATPRPLVGADFGRFENLWCGPEEAERRLMYREDILMVQKVVDDLRKTGYRI